MTEELESLKRVIERLNTGNFSYMLTGSMAMSFYSIPRMTRDSDILIDLDEKSIDRFSELFQDAFFLDKNGIKDSGEVNLMFNIFDKLTLFKFDFIFKKSNDYENTKFVRRRTMNISGTELFVISIEDLIISKLDWAKESHSEIQLNDIRELVKSEVDLKYIDQWVSRLKLQAIYKKL